MKSLLFVVTHKQNFSIPKENIYKSIAVGKNSSEINADYMDCSGDNISSKNPNYCELTAHYWIWKNMLNEYDVFGLCHYRRYFANSYFERFKILENKTIDKLLEKYDVILPASWSWKNNVKIIYKNGDGKEKDLETVRKVILEEYPEYVKDYDSVLNRRYSSYCNMFIMKRNDFDCYSSWLFSILSKVEEVTDLSDYTVAEARIYGYLSEILLNVWVMHNKLNIKYLPMIEIEKSKKSQIKYDFVYALRKQLKV